MDKRALQKFFAHGFIPAPNAILQGVYKLTAGSSITYDLAAQEITERRYWRFRVEPDESLGPDAEPRLLDELRARLYDAVRRRLMSDVPLGIFLSGGVDSSTALAFARAALPSSEIRTFTIGFTEPSYDESEYAARVAAHFDAVHLAETLDLDRAKELVPQVLGRLDEPLADPSLIPTFLLARFTRRHVTVALSGDGGDELFAGYDPFAALRPAQIYARIVPRILHGGMRRLADLIPRSARNMSLDFKIRRALLGLSYDEGLWNPVWLSPMSPDLIRRSFRGAARGGGPLLRGARGVAGFRPPVAHRPHPRVLHEVLPAGRHPDQGGSGGHDELARDPRRLPRQRSRRLRAPPPQPLQVSRGQAQVPAQTSAQGHGSGLRPGSSKEGLRDSASGMAARSRGAAASQSDRTDCHPRAWTGSSTRTDPGERITVSRSGP